MRLSRSCFLNPSFAIAAFVLILMVAFSPDIRSQTSSITDADKKLADQQAKDAAEAVTISGHLAKTAKKSAEQAAAAAGVALHGSSNVKDNVRIQPVMLPRDSAARVFGKEIANNYVVVQVTIDNESEDSSFLLGSVFLDYSKWALSGMMGDDAEEPGDCRIIDRLASSQVASCAGQVSSVEYRVIRGQLQDASTWSTRNAFVRAAIFVGSVGTGLGALKSKAALGYASAYSGDLIPALQILWPDPIVAQLNRVSDLGYQTNKVFPKGSADIVYAFFPIDRFLSPGLKELFLKSPALFFSPAQLFYDVDYPKKKHLKKTDVEKTKELIEKLLFDPTIDGQTSLAKDKAADKEAGAGNEDDLPNGTKQPKSPTDNRKDRLSEREVIAALLGPCPDTTHKETYRTCRTQKLFNEISLNRIHVVAGGVMSVNTLTVSASLQSVNFDAGNDSAALWTTVCKEQPGSITGRFLTNGSASVSKLILKDGSAGTITDYFDVLPFPGTKTEESDSALPFTMTLKNPIPSGSTINFQVTKYAAGDTKKTSGVKSMDYQFPVTYVEAKPGPGATAPIFDKTLCKDRAAKPSAEKAATDKEAKDKETAAKAEADKKAAETEAANKQKHAPNPTIKPNPKNKE